MEEKMLRGDGHIVEIDESVMIKRTYNHGGIRQQHNKWVFGMYDRTAKTGIKFVNLRDVGTLLPIIQEFGQQCTLMGGPHTKVSKSWLCAWASNP